MLPNKRAQKQVETSEPEETTTIWYLFVNHVNCPIGQIDVLVVLASLSVAIFMQRLNEEHVMILPHFHYLTFDPWTYKDVAILSKPTAEEFEGIVKDLTFSKASENPKSLS
jgi:hypothetical protein